jgi:hypothetical protein
LRELHRFGTAERLRHFPANAFYFQVIAARKRRRGGTKISAEDHSLTSPTVVSILSIIKQDGREFQKRKYV